MAEPEEVLIDAAYAVGTRVRRLWAQPADANQPRPVDTLDHHRRRLQLLVDAAFACDLPIRVAQMPPWPTLLRRVILRLPRALIDQRIVAGADGSAAYLPPRLTGETVESSRLYRIMALQQAVRAQRLLRQPLELPADDLRRGLFSLAEAWSADHELLEAFPGCINDLAALRVLARGTRLPRRPLRGHERQVADLQDRMLAAGPGDRDGLPTCVETDDSLAWESATERGLRAAEERAYRSLPSDLWWGRLFKPSASVLKDATAGEARDDIPDHRVGHMTRRPHVCEPEPDEDDSDDNVGPWMIQTDDPHEHAEDPPGLRRPVDQDDDSDPNDLADSLSELDQARLVATPDAAREILMSDDAPGTDGDAARQRVGTAAGIVYPEWDYRYGAYRQPGSTVRFVVPEPGDPRWAQEVIQRRSKLLREVRRHFERLRPTRQRRRRQADGDEIDIDAFVGAHAERCADGPIDDRLYAYVCPARRDIAIVLLVDISGSTDAWVDADQRIIDVEKEALLIVSDALDVLGDPYAIRVFSGHGPESVWVGSIKDFDQRDRIGVRERIAGLGPECYTRTGAAIRHATTLLAQRSESQRLLLLLSDGKPNDADQYDGRYGVEDARQAVREARMQGLHSFCLTVDRWAPSYLPKVFGPTGYAVLRDPTRLPRVLIDVLHELLA